MFNKLNTKTLAIAFGVLLVVVVLLQLFKNKQSDRNFVSQLFEVDTAKVSSIVITPKGLTEEIRLTRSGHEWTFIWNGKTYKAEKNIVNSMLSQLPEIKAERIAATEKSEWGQFEVTDSTSTRIKVDEGSKTVADFRVGKFSYQQPNTMTTFVRLTDADEVYAVNGFLAMTFNRNANDFRDKTIVNLNATDITKVTFTYPADSSFNLTKSNNGWKMNQTIAVDSAKTMEFINSIAHTSSYDFLDDNISLGNEVFSVNIEGKNFNPVKIAAFNADTLLVVTSSVNADARFDGKKASLADKLFAGKSKFLGKLKKE